MSDSIEIPMQSEHEHELEEQEDLANAMLDRALIPLLAQETRKQLSKQQTTSHNAVTHNGAKHMAGDKVSVDQDLFDFDGEDVDVWDPVNGGQPTLAHGVYEGIIKEITEKENSFFFVVSESKTSSRVFISNGKAVEKKGVQRQWKSLLQSAGGAKMSQGKGKLKAKHFLGKKVFFYFRPKNAEIGEEYYTANWCTPEHYALHKDDEFDGKGAAGATATGAQTASKGAAKNGKAEKTDASSAVPQPAPTDDFADLS